MSRALFLRRLISALLVASTLLGAVWGTVLNRARATLGTTGAFMLARYVASDQVRRQTAPSS